MERRGPREWFVTQLSGFSRRSPNRECLTTRSMTTNHKYHRVLTAALSVSLGTLAACGSSAGSADTDIAATVVTTAAASTAAVAATAPTPSVAEIRRRLRPRRIHRTQPSMPARTELTVAPVEPMEGPEAVAPVAGSATTAPHRAGHPRQLRPGLSPKRPMPRP